MEMDREPENPNLGYAKTPTTPITSTRASWCNRLAGLITLSIEDKTYKLTTICVFKLFAVHK